LTKSLVKDVRVLIKKETRSYIVLIVEQF